MEELYWADLSNLAPGRLASLMGIFRLIFESHHFIDAMLDRSQGWGQAILRRLLLLASWLMRGPIAALTISASLVCALLLYGPSSPAGVFGPLAALDAKWKFMFVQAVVMGLALFSVWRVFKFKDASWYDTTFWLGVIAAALFAVAWFDGFGRLAAWAGKVDIEPIPHLERCARELSADCYVNVPYWIVVGSWFLWCAIMLTALAAAVLLALRLYRSGDRAPIPAIFASVGVTVLQFMLWTVIVVSALFAMLSRGELVTGLSTNDLRARIGGVLSQVPRPDTAAVAPVQDLIETPKLLLPWIGPFKFIYAVTAMFLIAALLLMGCVYVRRWWLSRNYQQRLEASGDRAQLQRAGPVELPRLVFSPLLLGWLIIAVVVIIALIFTNPNEARDVSGVRGAMLGIAAIAAILFPFLLGHRTTNFIHIARDLLDHHYVPSLETAYYFFPSYFRPKARNPRRRRIQARLLEMLRQRVEKMPYTGIVFVAHSQGSVVVFDYLARDEDPVELGGAKIGLVTFGSPIGHIYEKYFHEYRETRDKIARVEARLEGWTNLTRVDDYIGGNIASDRATKISNVVLGCGGHTGYWEVKDIALAVDDMIRRLLAKGEPPAQPVSETASNAAASV
jgi:hypothetical protein